MNVTLLTAGSHGDVQPFVALGRGLQAVGHQVRLAAPSNFEDFAAENGVPFSSMGTDYRVLAQSENVKGAMAGNPLAMARAARESNDAQRKMLYASAEAAQDADVIIAHPKTFAGPHLAEALDIPCFLAIFAPLLAPTRDFPVPIANLPDISVLNPLTYAVNRPMAMPYHGIISQWRKEALGLGAQPRWAHPFRQNGESLPVLYAFSQAVVPPPADWPSHIHVTGWWFLEQDAAYRPSLALADFLAAGDEPVYIGFGSLAGKNPAQTTRLVLDAVQQANVRAILATGWGGLATSDVPSDMPSNVLTIDRAPHDWLFPRCAAVVHHGGSGTTAASLRAGKPTVICPFFGDQPFWGQRVQALGVGPAPLPQKKLTAAGLAQALRQATHDIEMQRRAAALSESLGEEDGVGRAVALIERAVMGEPRVVA